MEGRHLAGQNLRDAVPAHWPETSLRSWISFSRALNELVSRSLLQDQPIGILHCDGPGVLGVTCVGDAAPGQIEQECLAVYLLEKGPWCFQNQDDLDIRQAPGPREINGPSTSPIARPGQRPAGR